MQRSDESGLSAGGLMDLYSLAYIAKDYFDMCEDEKAVEKTRLCMIEMINELASGSRAFLKMVDECL